MLQKYSLEELKNKLEFIFYTMNGKEGGVQCWLDLYRKEYIKKYYRKPSNRELLNYMTN